MSGFGGTVKLTGESEYRKALSEISSSLKVLNSEMRAVTSEYDKNDTSVKNLSSQNEVLNKKVEEQEKKVSILKDALEKAKTETGENSETTKKWQTELNNAQAELNKLNRDVDTNEQLMRESEEATRKGYKSIDEMAEAEKKAQKETLTLGDVIKANLISDAIKAGLSALVDGFKALGSAMGDCLTEGAAYADNMLTLSAQTGLSTDTLEKYNAVAELTDVSMETLTKSMSKNIKSMSDARDGSKAYAEAYEKLGVQITNADGSLRDSETVYWETIDALKGVSDETERDALAMELFGKKAQELNTIIEMGSEGVAEYAQQAVNMGAVLGGEGLEALGALDDQMQIFSSTTGATKNILASAFAPAMSSALEGVNGLAGSLNGLIAAVMSEEGVGVAFEAFSESLTGFIGGIDTAIDDIMYYADLLLWMVLELIQEHLPTLVSKGMEMLTSIIQGIASAIPDLMPVVLMVIETLTHTILQNLPMILEMGIQMLVSLIEGISSMLPDLIPMAIDCVVLLAETLLDNIDLIIDAGIGLIFALADGLLVALPDLMDKAPVLIDKLIVAITDNLPKIIEMGIELTIKLVEGLIKAIPQLLKSIPQLISSFVKGFNSYYSKIGEIGLNLVHGLWNGIQNATGWILEKIKGFGQSVLNGIKSFFGIHSPSTVFKDEVGKNLALGVGEGFADSMAAVSDEMQSAIPTEFDTEISANMNMASARSNVSTYDMMVSAFKQALTEVKVILDDREMGGFVTDTVERVVYA